ncbi:MAG: aminotransferase class V-fold PLP-dependent enzyme, partial [Candidatus Moraniibacteriota bacterium]
IGVLYGRYDLLKKFPPTTFGGGMVLDACAPETVYKDIPARFEAGTPHIAGVIGLAAAIHFVQHLGISAIREHEQALIAYTLRRLKEEFGNDITLLGTNDPAKKSGIISFALVGIHPHDIASLLGEHDICVRAGLQCAAPLHESLGLPASTRISLSVYNSEHDIEVLIQGLKKVRVIL